MKPVTDNGVGFKLKMKWVIVEAGPLTASGLNEIILGGPTAITTRYMARECGIPVTKAGRYQLHKLADIYQK